MTALSVPKVENILRLVEQPQLTKLILKNAYIWHPEVLNSHVAELI